jgi:hypothetical protein
MMDPDVKEVILDQAEEIGKLRNWVDDLQSGMYVNCVYCGHRYSNREAPEPAAEVLKRHIATCPEHPMSAFIKCSTGAAHLIASLLAVRDGATDDLLRANLDAINSALASAGIPTIPGGTIVP